MVIKIQTSYLRFVWKISNEARFVGGLYEPETLQHFNPGKVNKYIRNQQNLLIHLLLNEKNQYER